MDAGQSATSTMTQADGITDDRGGNAASYERHRMSRAAGNVCHEGLGSK